MHFRVFKCKFGAVEAFEERSIIKCIFLIGKYFYYLNHSIYGTIYNSLALYFASYGIYVLPMIPGITPITRISLIRINRYVFVMNIQCDFCEAESTFLCVI
jgi:hypothetical protein